MPSDDDAYDAREDALHLGLDALDDRALVALLLGRHGGADALALASELLELSGGLAGLARSGPGVLVDQPGVGVARGLRLAAAIEVGRRLAIRAAAPGEPMTDPVRVAAFLTPRIGGLVHEEMWVLSLDGTNRLRGFRRVAQGGLHALSVSPGDVLRAALWDGASSFILAHNHPSGRLEASREDVETTVRLSVSAGHVGVPLVDHVIVTASGEYLSLAELGLIGERPRVPPRAPRRGKPS